ncbi:PREDICTED: esterase B1-like [Rhagoletis zephyria]|uniref:esterase B1-like n=1 Tax=Rhagoletis zephyria TaxID=28612 RepID=UPI0008115A29|nr:PREDICTED: esterase B1-like [Rhagoletis zephyria]
MNKDEITQEDNEQLLRLPLGEIRGQRCQTIYAHAYYSFEGIPYAKPPLGELRFKAPQPVEPWAGVKDCTQCASKPMQKNSRTGGVEGAEDCLYLNVYTKELKSEQLLPVMVFIFGGAYYMGGATRNSYSPDYFMSEKVVLVTLNYRLCSLGFLSLADPALQVPGNAALKDQILALRWVKQYISHFNGDPNNITVFGESAGAASVHALMLSEQTSDLFQRAVLMSGTALSYWVNMPQTDMAYRLAKFNGYSGENIDAEVLCFLQQLEPAKLVQHSLLNEEERRKLYIFPFGPIVEPYISADCVLPKRPFQLLKNTWSNRIPLIIGGNSFEGLFMYQRLKMFPQIMRTLLNDPERILPEDAKEAYTPEQRREMGTNMLKLFFGAKEPSDRSVFKFLDIYGYKQFWHDIHRTILARLSYASAPTYLYRFDFDSPDFNLYRAKFCGHDPVHGVAHADELSYMFFSNDSWKVSLDSAEYKTIRRLIGILVAFAKNSDPHCDEIKPIVWHALEKSNPSLALNISNDLSIMELPESVKLKAFDELFASTEQLY